MLVSVDYVSSGIKGFRVQKLQLLSPPPQLFTWFLPMVEVVNQCLVAFISVLDVK